MKNVGTRSPSQADGKLAVNQNTWRECPEYLELHVGRVEIL